LPGDYAKTTLPLLQRAQWVPVVTQTGVLLDAGEVLLSLRSRDLWGSSCSTAKWIRPGESRCSGASCAGSNGTVWRSPERRTAPAHWRTREAAHAATHRRRWSGS
jgi:hypothetical protein